MSHTTIRRLYYCWNDCVMSGCPGHTAQLDYQSTSEALSLDDGRGHKFFMQTPELAAFLDMVCELSGFRVEIASAIGEAGLEPQPKKGEE